MNDATALPPCIEEPELYFDPEPPEELAERGFDGEVTDDYRVAVARWKRETRERRLKAQLTCLTMCPLPRRALCEQLGAEEEAGIWGGRLPEDRVAIREGRPVRQRKDGPRSLVGGTRVKMTRELLSGLSIDEIAEMHGTKRASVLAQLTEQVMVLSAPSANMQVA